MTTDLGPQRGPFVNLRPCGTHAAFRRHERRGEAPCSACRIAEAEHQHKMYVTRRARSLKAKTDGSSC
jgi:hypothetical protein